MMPRLSSKTNVPEAAKLQGRCLKCLERLRLDQLTIVHVPSGC